MLNKELLLLHDMYILMTYVHEELFVRIIDKTIRLIAKFRNNILIAVQV